MVDNQKRANTRKAHTIEHKPKNNRWTIYAVRIFGSTPGTYIVFLFFCFLLSFCFGF